MSDPNLSNSAVFHLESEDFQLLIDALVNAGYTPVGPTVRDSAIIYDRIESVSDFPIGYTDKQGKGSYRLEKSKSTKLFDYVVGPHTWKKFLYPSERTLTEIDRTGQRFSVSELPREIPSYAFIGARSCELEAIAILDKVFAEGEYKDPYYCQARQKLFIVAVNCTNPGENCFCASMKTGPRVSGKFDVALTEVAHAKKHFFVVETGSEKGRDLISSLGLPDAEEAEVKTAESAVEKARGKMGKSIETDGLRDRLFKNFDHPYWEEVSSRCLTCGNCTMVCPTCFCANVEDATSLGGETAQRVRKWDSCYNVDFSYIHGGSIRASETSRYRQWAMHKLAYWPDQFGTYGCVGCGRCITWCPVGIDITETAAAVAAKS